MTLSHQDSARPDARAHGILRVTDSTGRVLGVRRTGMLQRLRLLEAVGPENARNAAYMSYAGLAMAVVEIDGEVCPPIATKRQLEARVAQLEEPGLTAAADALAADGHATGAAAGSAEDLAKNG